VYCDLIAMNESEAQAWLVDSLGVSRETLGRLDHLRTLVIAESANQNLISAATIPHFWVRHIVDSAQLLPLAQEAQPGAWLDLGTGAGFPGMVIAILSERPILLVESRRKRFEFLREMALALKLPHVSVRVLLPRFPNYLIWPLVFPGMKRCGCCQKDKVLKTNWH
jgi:16S rRNA (guanine527-N7)-methyltransferase